MKKAISTMEMALSFYPLLTGVRPPLQDVEKKRRISDGLTACKSPIGSDRLKPVTHVLPQDVALFT
ncbi:hypothetical protein [Domibacillus mangrovi]|uniref:Uncharacterized protein n=1 Tax=Domibacillus mangrovi TaxID=1714354 RepID=A0A1Q5P642_9BACI|nr:hypothetical protein [Domibacillus mangrovi]OKL37621.1 hypothetical protein BLL40_04790 [Domibacillus mangrovi]